jgi:hypothetical protein
MKIYGGVEFWHSILLAPGEWLASCHGCSTSQERPLATYQIRNGFFGE